MLPNTPERVPAPTAAAVNRRIEQDIAESVRWEELIAKVAERLGQTGPIDPRDAARAVFRVLDRHVPGGEMDQVKQQLPRDIRVLFPGGTGGPEAASDRAGGGT